MLSRERAVEHRREQREDVDLEGHGCGGAASSAAAAGVAAAERRTRCRGGDQRGLGAGLRRRGAFGRSERATSTSPAREVERRRRRRRSRRARGAKTSDDVADGRQVELADRAAADDVDLVLADAVDVARPSPSSAPSESRTVDADRPRASRLAAAELRRSGSTTISRYASRSALGGVAVGDLVGSAPASPARPRRPRPTRSSAARRVPSRCSTCPAANRASGRSVRTSTRTAPRRPWRPRTRPTTRRVVSPSGRLAVVDAQMISSWTGCPRGPRSP